MAILGRSRSTRKANDISPPVFTGTDAAPRSDLYKLNNAALSTHPPRIDSRVDSGFDMSPRFWPKIESADRKDGKPKSIPIVIKDDSMHETNVVVSPEPSPQVYYAEIYQDSTIGVALGSPDKEEWSPPPLSGKPPQTYKESLKDYAAQITTRITSDSQESNRPRSRKWKSFFSKKVDARSPKPFYQLNQRQSASLVSADDRRKSRAPQSGARSSDRRRFQPRSNRASVVMKSKRSTRVVSSSPGIRSGLRSPRGGASPQPPPKDFPPNCKLPRPTVPPRPDLPASVKGGMLNVDIPTSNMERYSIMFSNVLQPGHTNSIIARRKESGNDKLKPLNEFTVNTQSANSHLLRPRRATSPTAKSPSLHFSLFPNSSQSSLQNAPRPSKRMLQRAFTAPAVSPSRKTFATNSIASVPVFLEAPAAFASDVEETPYLKRSFDAGERAVIKELHQSVHKPEVYTPDESANKSSAALPLSYSRKNSLASPSSALVLGGGLPSSPKPNTSLNILSPRNRTSAKPPSITVHSPRSTSSKPSPAITVTSPLTRSDSLRSHPVHPTNPSQPSRPTQQTLTNQSSAPQHPPQVPSSSNAAAKTSLPTKDGPVHVAIARRVSVTRPRLASISSVNQSKSESQLSSAKITSPKAEMAKQRATEVQRVKERLGHSSPERWGERGRLTAKVVEVEGEGNRKSVRGVVVEG